MLPRKLQSRYRRHLSHFKPLFQLPLARRSLNQLSRLRIHSYKNFRSVPLSLHITCFSTISRHAPPFSNASLNKRHNGKGLFSSNARAFRSLSCSSSVEYSEDTNFKSVRFNLGDDVFETHIVVIRDHVPRRISLTNLPLSRSRRRDSFSSRRHDNDDRFSLWSRDIFVRLSFGEMVVEIPHKMREL